jgi:signal transduction histidine kinase
MHQILIQILHFLQQGIAAIFRFVELIWTWSVDQVMKLAAVPWNEWPILKVILLVVIVVAVVWALYQVFWELWLGAERVLSAFARLLVVFVQTLPRVLLAGIIALVGVWLMNHLDNSTMRIPTSLLVWQQQPQQPQAQPNQESDRSNQ